MTIPINPSSSYDREISRKGEELLREIKYKYLPHDRDVFTPDLAKKVLNDKDFFDKDRNKKIEDIVYGKLWFQDQTYQQIIDQLRLQYEGKKDVRPPDPLLTSLYDVRYLVESDETNFPEFPSDTETLESISATRQALSGGTLELDKKRGMDLISESNAYTIGWQLISKDDNETETRDIDAFSLTTDKLAGLYEYLKTKVDPSQRQNFEEELFRGLADGLEKRCTMTNGHVNHIKLQHEFNSLLGAHQSIDWENSGSEIKELGSFHKRLTIGIARNSETLKNTKAVQPGRGTLLGNYNGKLHDNGNFGSLALVRDERGNFIWIQYETAPRENKIKINLTNDMRERQVIEKPLKELNDEEPQENISIPSIPSVLFEEGAIPALKEFRDFITDAMSRASGSVLSTLQSLKAKADEFISQFNK